MLESLYFALDIPALSFTQHSTMLLIEAAASIGLTALAIGIVALPWHSAPHTPASR